jgi:hypothetical protein
MTWAEALFKMWDDLILFAVIAVFILFLLRLFAGDTAGKGNDEEEE